MTGLSFLRALLRALARDQLDVRRVLDDREQLAADLQKARAGWDTALDMLEQSTRLHDEITAERDQLLTALRAAAAGQREYAAMCMNKASESQRRERREHELTAVTLETAIQFVKGDPAPLYMLLPSWRWTDDMVREIKESDEKP